MNKYQLTDETLTLRDGAVLHRIEALRDFGDVKAGDLGGFIQSERNLSHRGNCWVEDNARVFGNSQVFGYARVYEYAEVFENTKVGGYKKIGLAIR